MNFCLTNFSVPYLFLPGAESTSTAVNMRNATDQRFMCSRLSNT